MKATLISLVAALALVACAGPSRGPTTTASADPVSDPVVTVSGMAFQNGSVTVTAGTTVTWVWDDAPIEHNVVADDGSFESPLQSEGTWTHTFTEPGSFDYHCGPHPNMRGTITVIQG